LKDDGEKMKRLQAVLRKYNKQLKMALLSKIKKNISPHSKEDEITISMLGRKQWIYQRTASHIIRELTKHGTVPPLEDEDKQEG